MAGGSLSHDERETDEAANRQAVLRHQKVVAQRYRACYSLAAVLKSWSETKTPSEVYGMKQGIHPDYQTTTVVCSCGNRFETRSTAGGELHVELCDKCHPFYTGQQKFVDTGGRVQRFSDKFGSAANVVLEKEAAERDARRKAGEEAALKAREEREAKVAEKAARAAKFDVSSAGSAAEAEVVEAEPEVVAEVVEETEAVAEVADETPEVTEESAE
jgi:large subunit ribosomal protein L31